MMKFVLAIGAMALGASATLAAPPREAAVILKEYADVKVPEVNEAGLNSADLELHIAEKRRTMDKQNALALEMFQAHPEHVDAIPMMLKRWSNMTSNSAGHKATTEIETYLKDHPNSKHRAEVLHQLAIAAIYGDDMTKVMAPVEAFIKSAPQDSRGGELLSKVAGKLEESPEQLQLYRRIVSDYSGSRAAVKAAHRVRQLEGLGKPFELAFEDASSGKPVSIRGLAGKIVVIDFWATWCPPCRAEVPDMKRLYAQYQGDGVEFVGISLDDADGGLDKLKAFVKENDIPWPQYYQGNGWESEFSKSWGIHSIPSLFVVDADGNLYSTTARYKLKNIIPELIKKRDDKR